uniref:Bestrophin homolog n=1 Tax=Angiostrongylus cantonensis TaxID=6313 RepID=A0A0K0DQ21_ANGCA
MTVSYNLDISSVTTLSFVRLLFRWRGSIWKSVVVELTMWIISFLIISCVYRYAMDEDEKRTFERLAAYCDTKLDYIPLTFMLGFFVTIVVDRWRQIFSNMGWIEDVALTIATLIRGDSKEIILTRRTIIRYMVLSQVLVFRDVSMRVRRRFPNMESIVTAGKVFFLSNSYQLIPQKNLFFH